MIQRDEVAVQTDLDQRVEAIEAALAPLNATERNWVFERVAEKYCLLCGRARIGAACFHGDRG